MDLLTIILIALALAMDAFAVSIVSGIIINQVKVCHAIKIAVWFGIFQALMPLIGLFGGTNLKALISDFDHWIVFGLLLFIGAKMIYESFQPDSVEERSNPLDLKVLFTLSIATSLDAFAVGISFALLGIPIFTPIIVIGAVTFIMSFTGVWIGENGKRIFGKKVEVVAGLILIFIGVRVLISHLS